MESHTGLVRDGGPFESPAFDRFDVRVLLPESGDIDPLRHPSAAWQDACNNADLPEPPR
jgi:hypothetical protein